MNAIEMIYLFEQFLGTLDATYQKPKTSDTLDFINTAQHDMHTEYYKVLDINEDNKKLMAPFQVLDHEIVNFITVGGSMFNAVRITLPPSLQYVTREELQVNVDEYGRIGVGNGPTMRSVRPINYDEYNANKNNPVRQPYYDESWRLDAIDFVDAGAPSNEHLLIMAPGIVPEKYYISYVKEIVPLTEEIISESQFPAWHHDEIVKRAVNLYVSLRTPQEEPEIAKKEG